jgi:DNA polymerase III subunit gamma/tau
MSYQVLARKWRPRNFDSLVGQDHVVRALTQALDQKRLHHAYLFAGTRGVGKTTLARILAKALNCETGITSRPCGKCSACLEIDSGRHVDLMEVDAATNTKVDEMRQLLENAVYSPTRGRFKIYVIDEVHMLSTSAFNAMLKTLEEPPEHIKFVLATTDPQKIPVTVLSRCLQFNLKQIPAGQISGHLAEILTREQIGSEVGALKLVAAAAHGSMRDALSLLDQAIAYCGGDVNEAGVQAMLGTVDSGCLFEILEALARGEAGKLLSVAQSMEDRNFSLDNALQELAALFHRLALAQAAPETVYEDNPFKDRIRDLKDMFTPEELQLNYQIAIHGRQDLPYAPDSYAGFTMALLRMLAFRPDDTQEGKAASPQGVSESRETTHSAAGPLLLASADWPRLAQALKVSGIARQLAHQSALLSCAEGAIELSIPSGSRHLAGRPYQDNLRKALEEHFGRAIRLVIRVGETAGNSAHERAVEAIHKDAFVHDLLEQFDGTIVESSIKPMQSRDPK